jgi:hypothetical protein
LKGTIPEGFYSERLPDGRIALFPGPRPSGKRPDRSPQARWDAAHLVTLSTRVQRPDALRFLMVCDSMGMTPYAAIKEYVLRTARKAPPSAGGR